jgi:putative spermidine/putrescine transport system permease protein
MRWCWPNDWRRPAGYRRMTARWGMWLLPPLLLMILMLVFTQFIFLKSSFFADLGLGQTGHQFTLENYVSVLTDPLYLRGMRLTLILALSVVAITLVMSYPVSYMLARMPARIASLLLAAIVSSSFVSVAIKILGMVIIFAADGVVSCFFRWIGIIETSMQLLGTTTGVVFGCIHLAIGFMVTMLFSVIQTIPVKLEEAAQIHGASRWRVYWRVIVPLSLPGVLNAVLIQFNLLMGAFVTVTILGGGKVLTFPVLIQRTLMMFNDYGLAAALSAVLLFIVLTINFASIIAVTRLRAASIASA